VNHDHRQLHKTPEPVLRVSEEVSAGRSFRLPVTFKKWQWDASFRIYISLDGPKGESSLISGFPRNPLNDKTWRKNTPTLNVYNMIHQLTSGKLTIKYFWETSGKGEMTDRRRRVRVRVRRGRGRRRRRRGTRLNKRRRRRAII